MGRNRNGLILGVILPTRCRICLRLIEQADLVRRQLLAAGGITPGQGQIELFLEGEDFGVETNDVLIRRRFLGQNLRIEGDPAQRPTP